MVLNYIKSDLYRYGGNVSLKAFLKNYFLNRGFNFTFWLRLAKSKGLIGLLARPILFYKNRKYGIDISHRTKIGYGLYIGHGGPLIVNNRAIIGNNVNLSQYTTIGINKGQAATIGDNVYLGPSVCVVGGVKIGSNATIGAGSVVTKDIPENATAAGNYAKVLNYNEIGSHVNNRWKV